MVVPSEEDKKWYLKSTIEYVTKKSNLLLDIRYKLAALVMTLFVGLWTVIFVLASQPANVWLISTGIFLSIIIIAIWRIFTHFIIIEANMYNFSICNCLNKLGLLTETDSLFEHIENLLNLKVYSQYNAIGSLDKKLSIMRKLTLYYPDNGVFIFDVFATLLGLFLLIVWKIVIFTPVPKLSFQPVDFYFILTAILLTIDLFIAVDTIIKFKIFAAIQSQ